MKSVDKTYNCILPSGRIQCQYFHYVNTQFMSPLSRSLENQPIMSLKYIVITLRLRQNERRMAFGVSVARTRVTALQI